MASYSVHFIIFIHVTMLVDISNCFDNRTKCQLCDNDNNTNITICSDFNVRNRTKMQCNNRNISISSNSSSDNNNHSSSYEHVFNQLSTNNNSTKLSLQFVESFPIVDLIMFPNVTILKIKCNEKLMDFNKVKNSANITVLNLTTNAIARVTNMTAFENLRLLDLSNNLITNLSTIVTPAKLEVLDLSSNRINIENNITLPDNLRWLNLSDNNINSTDNVTVTGLLHKLDLSRNKIRCVRPFTNVATLEELYLSHNNISRLEDGVFARLSSLTRLDLSANKLRSLGDRCFAGLNRLQHLDISENAVFSMEPGTFQYMTNLIRLKLSGNVNLGEPEKPNKDDVSLLLGTGQRLQTLEASRTNLTRIPSTLTRSVRMLLLAENKIGYVQCGDLDSYPLLQTLNLTRNRIQDIEDDALGRLEFLGYLLLSGNLLQSIPRSLPDNLIVLDLNSNNIESLTINDFVGLTKLQTLALRNNKIQTISDATFAQLASLQVLDLSVNPVRMLSSNTFIGPRKLKQLILSSLTNVTPRKELLSFPVPETGQLQLLNLSSSSTLVNQLLDDIAALTMFRQLTVLDISYGNITNIRLDLDRYLPRLKVLLLSGNKFNCTESILTLAKLLGKLKDNRQKREEEDEDEGYQYLSTRENRFSVKHCERCFSDPLCSFPDNLRGRPIRSLNDGDFFKTTTSSTTTMATTTTMRTTMVSTTMVTPTMPVSLLTTLLPSTTRTVHKHNITITRTKSPTISTATYETHALTSSSNVKTLINFTLPLTSNETAEDVARQQNDTIPEDSSVPPLNTSESTDPYHVVPSSNATTERGPYYNVSADDYSANVTGHMTNDAAYLASKEKGSVSSTSHPGMFVFLSILSMILMASVIMMSSQWRQYRYRLEMSRGYMPQQDIEVRSLSSVGGYDLW